MFQNRCRKKIDFYQLIIKSNQFVAENQIDSPKSIYSKKSASLGSQHEALAPKNLGSRATPLRKLTHPADSFQLSRNCTWAVALLTHVHGRTLGRVNRGSQTKYGNLESSYLWKYETKKIKCDFIDFFRWNFRSGTPLDIEFVTELTPEFEIFAKNVMFDIFCQLAPPWAGAAASQSVIAYQCKKLILLP